MHSWGGWRKGDEIDMDNLIDIDNQVVKLCVEGMQAEAEGRFADARTCFEQAWDVRQNDFDACIAAHYMARHQDTLERILHWN